MLSVDNRLLTVNVFHIVYSSETEINVVNRNY